MAISDKQFVELLRENPEHADALSEFLGSNDDAGASAAVERSPLENLFVRNWAALDGPDLLDECKFHPNRRWRADFYHEGSRVIIEIEGGIWSEGRHVRGLGFIEDCRKYNAAAMLGYRVIRLTEELINDTRYLEWLIEELSRG